MGQAIPQLWSELDLGAVRACRRAVEIDDLLGALFAIEGAGRVARIETRLHLERWAEAVRAAPGDTASALSDVLGHALRAAPMFTADPRALSVSAICAGEPGLPVVLSAVWLVVAQLADRPLSPVSVPGQVLLATADGRVIDPAQGGAVTSPRTLRALQRSLELPAVPPPCPTVQIIDRTLRDLLFCGELAHDDVTRFRAVSFLSYLHPDQPGPLVALGMVAETVGASGYAKALYERAIERFGDTHEAAIARRRAGLLVAESPTVH